MSYSNLLTNTVTAWSPSINDGFGGLSYSTPRQILCRWQEVNVLHNDTAGEEFISKAVVFADELLEANGWLFEGTSAEANPQNQVGAYRIRRIMKSPTPNASIIVYEYILG